MTGVPFRVPERLIADPAFRRACAGWQAGVIFSMVMRTCGLTLTRTGRLCGLYPSRVSDYMLGRHTLKNRDVVTRIADGLGIPGHLLGLAPRPWEAAPARKPLPAPAVPHAAERPERPSPERNIALVRARQERKWTQQELADALAARLEAHHGKEHPVDIRCIRSWEAGEDQWPHTHHRRALAEIFNRDVRQLGFQPISADDDSEQPGDVTPSPDGGPERAQEGASAGIDEPSETLLAGTMSADGTIEFMTVPRRSVVIVGVSTVIAAQGPLCHKPLKTQGSATPIEHFRRLRDELVKSDNLFGPQLVIPAVTGQITLLMRLRDTANGSDRIETLRILAAYAEFASWLSHDSGAFQVAGYWLDRAMEYAQSISDRQLIAFILARKSQLAGDMMDHASAIDLGNAACAMSPADARMRAFGLQYQAYGEALAGNETGSLKLLDDAITEISDGEYDPSGQFGAPCDEAYVSVHRARSLVVLGRYGPALRHYDTALSSLSTDFHRDRGVYLARMARAHLGAGSADEACAAAEEALNVARETGSGRIMQELAAVRTDLSGRPATTAAREFDEHFTDAIRSSGTTATLVSLKE